MRLDYTGAEAARPVGWRLRAAAAATLAVAAGGCTEPGPPVSTPYPETEAPRLVAAGDVPFVEHVTPAESLLVIRGEPPADASLVFFRGRGVSSDAAGDTYLPDGAASRVLVLDRSLRVARTIGGPDESDGGLGLPLSVAATPEGAVFVVDVEHSRGLLYFEPSGEFVGASTPPVLNGHLRSGPDASLWATRSPYILGFEPTEPGDPLIYRFDPLEGEGTAIGGIEAASDSRWNRLANAGPIAVGADGSAYFAFLLRNEIRAYDDDGALRWRVRRVLGFDAGEPRKEARQMEVGLRPFTQALGVGPDGLLYALTAGDSLSESGPSEASGVRRIEVYDPETGDLLRASTIPTAWTSFAVDDVGRVYAIDSEAILAGAPPPVRPLLPDVEFEDWEGRPVRFSEHRGKALLVNFWASWCGPCREELPQLAKFYESIDHQRGEILAISEDEDVAAARAFAAGMDLPFPLFLAQGSLQERLHYVALPYTLIVDYRGRIVEEFYGFGSPESWESLKATFRAEIERAAPADATAGHDHAAEPEDGHEHPATPPEADHDHGG